MTQTAMVRTSFGPGLTFLTTLPLTSVELAREEFGATLADAQAFVESTCCTECGQAAEEVQTCVGCDVRLCACALVTQHNDELACADCDRPCYGRCCYED